MDNDVVSRPAVTRGEDIRKHVSPMVIWMADAAIREARKALAKHKDGPEALNTPEINVAAEVLFRMFYACVADIKLALIQMPEQLTGYFDLTGMNYLDTFMEKLAEVLTQYPHTNPLSGPSTVELREADWVLRTL